MSPEYEGPQDEDEAAAPRRVKHLIVLPGGAEPEDGEAGADPQAPAGEPSPQLPEPRRQARSSGAAPEGAASVAAAQMTDAIPLEVSPAR